MRIAVSLLILATLCCQAGCGGSHPPALTGQVVTAQQWKAVFYDFYEDGRIDGRYSCAAAVIATSHLPTTPPMFSNVIRIFDTYTASVCHPGSLDAVHVGMTDTDVGLTAGAPQLPAYGCWQYDVTLKHTGLRVCFENGRATIVQQAVHG